jgi:adenylate cyclase
MSEEAEDDRTQLRMTVLYADVSGSTRLYEQYGDAIARADVAVCLGVLGEVAAALGGKIIKTIGDEVMCTFPDPAKAAVAAAEMNIALREASRQKRFQTGTLRVKIGWHYGRISWRDGELIGEAPVLAQQVIRKAKAEEILTSGRSLEALPVALRRGARFIDRIEPEIGKDDLDVYELPWEETDDLTKMSTPGEMDNGEIHATLTLEHDGKKIRIDSERAHFKLGRAPDNDLAVSTPLASRHHAEITFRHGRFHLADNSTNGTVVVTDSGHRVTRLQREEIPLPEQGWIALGGAPAEHPDDTVSFRCE